MYIFLTNGSRIFFGKKKKDIHMDPIKVKKIFELVDPKNLGELPNASQVNKVLSQVYPWLCKVVVPIIDLLRNNGHSFI